MICKSSSRIVILHQWQVQAGTHPTKSYLGTQLELTIFCGVFEQYFFWFSEEIFQEKLKLFVTAKLISFQAFYDLAYSLLSIWSNRFGHNNGLDTWNLNTAFYFQNTQFRERPLY